MAAKLVFDQVCSQVFDKFVRVCDMLSTRCRLFAENQLHQSLHVEIHAAGSLVRARARLMESRKKNPFEPANEPVEAGFSLRIRAYHDVIK